MLLSCTMHVVQAYLSDVQRMYEDDELEPYQEGGQPTDPFMSYQQTGQATDPYRLAVAVACAVMGGLCGFEHKAVKSLTLCNTRRHQLMDRII